MDALSVALIAFVAVGGSMFLSGVALLRWWPALRRERLMAAIPEAGPATVLRWQTARSGWQRLVERLGQWRHPRTARSFRSTASVWRGPAITTPVRCSCSE